jgi:hypothetical protein
VEAACGGLPPGFTVLARAYIRYGSCDQKPMAFVLMRIKYLQRYMINVMSAGEFSPYAFHVFPTHGGNPT